jgi:hypothetical protein
MIEIGLTIWAWNRGWKAWTLLPWGIGILVAIILAFADGPFIIGDGIIYFSLIVMIIAERKKSINSLNQQYQVPSADTPSLNQQYQIPSAVTPSLNQNSNFQPYTSIVPPTVVLPLNNARFVLSDRTEIHLTENKTLGRMDFERALPHDSLIYLSRQQLETKSDSGRYFVQDNHSANGTKINGIDIKSRGWQELREGDKVDLAGVAALTFKSA